jgi:polyisoprenoid-binding protein YceI
MDRSHRCGPFVPPTVFAAIVCGVLPCWCLAQNQAATPVAATPAQITYEAGDVYLPNSRAYVFVGKKGFGHEHGVVGQIKQGRIDLNATNNAGSLVFDMASFTADTPEARKFVGLKETTDASSQKQVTSNMRGVDVLDVARHPTATFTIKQVVKLPELSANKMAQYKLAGDFVLHGATRPIQVVVEAEEKDGWTHLRGSFTMLQSQFGITPFKKALGAVGVADQLSVWGDIWVAKQRQVVAAASTSQH